MTAITIDHVSRSFGTVRAVDDVSLEIRDGEFFTLLGPSGCGETMDRIKDIIQKTR